MLAEYEKPDIGSFNVVLYYCAKTQDLQLFKKVWEVMKEREIELDGQAFSWAIRMMYTVGNAERAKEYYDSMIKRQVKSPQSSAYTYMLKCWENDPGQYWEDATKVIDDIMENDEMRKEPNPYIIAMRMCAEARMWKPTFVIIQQLASSGLKVQKRYFKYLWLSVNNDSADKREL